MPTSVDAGRRAPRRDATANRESLLNAASAVLATAPDASLDAIARAAGLTRRSVYGHFANRDDLVLALIERGSARLNRTAGEAVHPDARIALALLAARLWDAVAHVRLLASMAVHDPYTAYAASALEPVRAGLRAIVARGALDRTLRSDLDADLVARLVEQAAIAVLDEADRLDPPAGRRIVMLATLGAAGLSWEQAGTLVDRSPELDPAAAPAGEATA
ncbi:TetR/AcrR family transcriptional regulator [Agromyces sp. LHK192]|uniref:TetR/AcrR family transcriptional regulator n=1 Tax=Agromyces sp. LHK192 TaxID=2498704 RepID=UPI000FD82291|nr:TetR/AcrR family transcriptional regulator [Agromyces sp. LHK192]